MGDVKPRPYTSPVRAEQAARTRLAVLGAARDLFLEQGFGATTIDQIARRAGVSKPTVFNAAGSKPQLLKLVRDLAMSGDDQAVPVVQRPSVDQARNAPTAAEAVRALAAHIAGLLHRYARIDAVVRAAAASGEPELQALWQQAELQRRKGAELLLQIVASKGALRHDQEKAADVLSNFMAPDHYQRLVHDLGWKHSEYEAWLSDTLIEQLLLNAQGNA